MCFLIRAMIPRTKAHERQRFAGAVPGTEGRLAWALSEDRGNPLELQVPGEQCACVLVSGKADSNASVWKLDPKWSPLIATAVTHLIETTRTEVLIWATWFGDPALNRKQISLTDLVAEIASHRFPNRTEFSVKKSKKK